MFVCVNVPVLLPSLFHINLRLYFILFVFNIHSIFVFSCAAALCNDSVPSCDVFLTPLYCYLHL